MRRRSRLMAVAGSAVMVLIGLCAVGGVRSNGAADPALKKGMLRGPGVTPKKKGQFRINLIGKDLPNSIAKSDVTLTLKPSGTVVPLDKDPQIINGRILRLTATLPDQSGSKLSTVKRVEPITGDDDTVTVDVSGLAPVIEVPLAVEP